MATSATSGLFIAVIKSCASYHALQVKYVSQTDREEDIRGLAGICCSCQRTDHSGLGTRNGYE